jgi:hypothetical protein
MLAFMSSDDELIYKLITTSFYLQREAEKERRKSGLIGSAVSDDYINSLGKKPEPSAD